MDAAEEWLLGATCGSYFELLLVRSDERLETKVQRKQQNQITPGNRDQGCGDGWVRGKTFSSDP